MRLYHGTSLAAWRDIEAAGGIKPRSETNGSGRKVWHEHPSNPEMIYLTDCYGMYFAGAASHEHDSADAAVLIEVEVDPEDLFPDEDFLEAATRTMKDLPIYGADLAERTEFFRERLWLYPHLAKDSLAHLGTVAHNGEIPIEKITRVVTFNPIPLTFVFDPTITMLNHTIMSDYYESGTAWIMDGTPVSSNYNMNAPEVWEKLRTEIGATTIYENSEEAA
jgi:hypothetical protein